MKNEIIRQTNSLRDFARDVIHLLFNEDKFSRLIDNRILVNYGSPVDDVSESDIGFLLETRYSKGGIEYCQETISLEGLLFWSNKPNWDDVVKKRNGLDVFEINSRKYLFSLQDWSEEAKCYPDGTLVNYVINDLKILIDLYYSKYSIEKIGTSYILLG